MLQIGERKPGKKHVHSRMIKNFGASCDETELNKLIQEAEEYKQHLLLVSPKASTLKITSSRDIKSCLSFTVACNTVNPFVWTKSGLNISLGKGRKSMLLAIAEFNGNSFINTKLPFSNL